LARAGKQTCDLFVSFIYFLSLYRWATVAAYPGLIELPDIFKPASLLRYWIKFYSTTLRGLFNNYLMLVDLQHIKISYIVFKTKLMQAPVYRGGFLNMQVRLNWHNKVWLNIYLWRLWIWSHLKLELSMSFR